MLDTVFSYLIGYILIGITLAFFIDTDKWYTKLIFIVWPIVILFVICISIFSILQLGYKKLVEFLKFKK